MNRRAFINVLGVIGGVSLEGTKAIASEMTKPAANENADVPPSVDCSPFESTRKTDQSFEVLERRCGRGENQAEVEHGNERVVVGGTIRGNNTCYTAELERADYDADADTLTVDVHSYENNGGDFCGMCLLDIEYRATVEFDGGAPNDVVVNHNGEQVTESSRLMGACLTNSAFPEM